MALSRLRPCIQLAQVQPFLFVAQVRQTSPASAWLQGPLWKPGTRYSCGGIAHPAALVAAGDSMGTVSLCIKS